jgi:HEAT repeat protein
MSILDDMERELSRASKFLRTIKDFQNDVKKGIEVAQKLHATASNTLDTINRLTNILERNEETVKKLISVFEKNEDTIRRLVLILEKMDKNVTTLNKLINMLDSEG